MRISRGVALCPIDTSEPNRPPPHPDPRPPIPEPRPHPVPNPPTPGPQPHVPPTRPEIEPPIEQQTRSYGRGDDRRTSRATMTLMTAATSSTHAPNAVRMVAFDMPG